MRPYEVIAYKGKKIIIIDISYSLPEEAINYFNAARPKIARLPPKSALILTDASGVIYTDESVNALKNFVDKNTPHIKASAVVGSEGVIKVVQFTVERYAGRKFKNFPTREEALDWLTDQ